MKLKLYNIITALLIATYVFSTIGVSVIEHYCGGELEEVAVFLKPKSCCAEEEEESDVSTHFEPLSMLSEATTEDGCCKNKVSHLVFHKDFTFKILIKKNVDQHLDSINNLFPIDCFVLIKNPIQRAHYFIPPKIPPPKLLQQYIVECSVIRV